LFTFDPFVKSFVNSAIAVWSGSQKKLSVHRGCPCILLFAELTNSFVDRKSSAIYCS